MGALIQAPTLPSPTNYVDIDPEKKDIFGIPQLRFHFQWGQNELLMWEHSKQVMIDLFKAMGGELWGADSEPNRPGTSLHETGVCRFGSDPKTSVTNKWAQTHDVTNLSSVTPAYFPVHRQDHNHANRRLHHADLRSNAQQFQERRSQTRMKIWGMEVS